MSTAQLYGQFTKIEQLADGTLYVEGIASSEAEDAAGEIIKASAMRDALPEYLKFPALREMHETWAAGRTVRAEVLGDGTTHIAAKVVDAEAVKKVKERVYNGFSIGGSVTKRNATDSTIIEGLTLTEISLVDRPANPDCVMQLVKIQQEKPMPADDIKKFLGQETMDARMAIDALGIIQSLLGMEMGENHPEAGAQIADLQAAIARIKAFVASEIVEADPAEGAGSEVAPVAKDAVLPPAADGSGAPPPPTAEQVTAKEDAAPAGDLAKMDSGVAAAMDKAMKAHRAKMAKMHEKLASLVEEFAKLGWQEEKPDDAKPTDENPDAKPEDKPKEECNKEDAAKAGDLQKRLTEAEQVATDAGTELAKVMKQRDDLMAAIQAKGSLRAVPKEADAPEADDKDEKKPTDTISLIKAAHARPISLM
jgi:phage head maturation protease